MHVDNTILGEGHSTEEWHIGCKRMLQMYEIKSVCACVGACLCAFVRVHVRDIVCVFARRHTGTLLLDVFIMNRKTGFVFVTFQGGIPRCR